MKRPANEHDGDVERVANELLEGAVPIEPPAALRAKVLQRVRDEAAASPDAGMQVWKRWSGNDPARLHTVPLGEGAWEPTAVAGVDVRRLYVDVARDEVTMMVRMAAGTAYPPHRHRGPEQCLVLSGDLRVGDRMLSEGDFQYAPAETLHGVQSTESGCTLLIISSMHDELLVS